jgi:hypothetical protein
LSFSPNTRALGQRGGAGGGCRLEQRTQCWPCRAHAPARAFVPHWSRCSAQLSRLDQRLRGSLLLGTSKRPVKAEIPAELRFSSNCSSQLSEFISNILSALLFAFLARYINQKMAFIIIICQIEATILKQYCLWASLHCEFPRAVCSCCWSLREIRPAECKIEMSEILDQIRKRSPFLYLFHKILVRLFLFRAFGLIHSGVMLIFSSDSEPGFFLVRYFVYFNATFFLEK